MLRDGRPRVASPAPAAWNVAKTLLQTAAMWGLFFVALPAAVHTLEARVGLAGWRFDPEATRAVAVAAFAGLGSIGVYVGALMAIAGHGTPLPLDTARRLVIRGLYRHIRNPMAMSSLGQGFAVGAWLGSPAVLLYVAVGCLVWNYLARPWEERDLVERFGAEYEEYRDAVPCWRVRLMPYRTADERAAGDA